MSTTKSAHFLTDVELTYEWYALSASWEVAERYLGAIEATCALIASHPRIGTAVEFLHPRLASWRFLVVMRPFHRHIVFYEATDGGTIFRRAMHGHRNLPRRLREAPGAG